MSPTATEARRHPELPQGHRSLALEASGLASQANQQSAPSAARSSVAMASRRSPLPLAPPPDAPPPRLLPDGSESQYHEGSFRSYMYHKNRKLQEQFQANAGILPDQQRTQLFAGVSIHVNGYTVPSHSVRCWPAGQAPLAARMASACIS